MMGLLAVNALAATRPDRNAYLNTGVRSVAALIAEVRNDPEVADRYERHFAMSKHDVIEMFSTLHVQRLAAPITVTMYSVPPSGAIKTHQETLERGVLVFANPSGQPVLKALCGNPVVPGREETVAADPPELVQLDPGQLKSLLPDTVADPTVSDTETFALAEPSTPIDLLPTPPPVIPVPPDTIGTVVTPPPSTAVAAAGSGGSNLSGLWLLLPAGALIGLASHGGGGAAPVPEPASTSLLLVSVVALAARRKRP